MRKDSLDAFGREEIHRGQVGYGGASEVVLIDVLVAGLQLPTGAGLGPPTHFVFGDAGDIHVLPVHIFLNLLQQLLGQDLCCFDVAHAALLHVF